MLDIEIFALELSTNPQAMKKIETEVDNYVQMPSCSILYDLQNSKVPSIHIFLCKILEMRIKKKAISLDLADEIQLSTNILAIKPSFQICEVYSLLGLYCWPIAMPNFIDNVVSLLICKTGYQILLAFLEKVNTNTSIDEKRRTELKKALSIIGNQLLLNFKEDFADLIIPIYTEFLKILPKNYDFSLVFSKAQQNPDEAISFFVEGISYFDPNKLTDILDGFPTDAALVQLITSIKITKINTPTNVYSYVFKCLINDKSCFKYTIEFWVKTFSSKAYSNMVQPVLSEVLKLYLVMDDETKDEVEQHVFGFFTVISKNYPEIITAFLKTNGDHLPQKITANFIQKLNKSENSQQILNSFAFNSPYLNCLVNYLRNDSNTQNLLFNLDLKDKDSVKLALLVIEKYNFTSGQFVFILKMCENSCLSANEVKVVCFIKLGMHESFGDDWNLDTVIKYFYCIKKAPAEYLKYKDIYYSLFIRSSPFDRCFSILEKIGNVPPIILQNIYEKMDKYPFLDVCCLNSDLLAHLENPAPFIDKEVSRLVKEWNTITDHKDYYQTIKSLLTVLSLKADTIPISEYLLDLIQINSSLVLNKVLPVFNSYNGQFNVTKAVYYLISAYNLPNVSESHQIISTSLAECLYKEDGPLAYHNVLGIDINKCCELRAQMIKVNKRTAINMVKDLIKDFKGKPFNKMFETENKVTKQNFLPPKPQPDNDYTLKNVNFI